CVTGIPAGGTARADHLDRLRAAILDRHAQHRHASAGADRVLHAGKLGGRASRFGRVRLAHPPPPGIGRCPRDRRILWRPGVDGIRSVAAALAGPLSLDAGDPPPVRLAKRTVAPAVAPSRPRLLWHEPEYEVELFEQLGPERADCEARMLAAGLPLPVQHRTEWAIVHPTRRLWFVAVKAAGAGYQAGFAVDVSRSRAMPGHVLFSVEKFGAALSDGARAAGLRALAHLGRSRARVLRVHVDVYAQDRAIRERVGTLLQELGFRSAAQSRTYRDTVLVDLAPDEDGILATFRRSTRRNIRQIAEQPFEVRTIARPAPVGRLEALLGESLARTGGPPHHEDWNGVTALSDRCPELSRLTGLFRTDAQGPEALVAFAWG